MGCRLWFYERVKYIHNILEDPKTFKLLHGHQKHCSEWGTYLNWWIESSQNYSWKIDDDNYDYDDDDDDDNL
jgi:hypothetical protein